MTVPPIDFGAVGVRFEHNPGAQDAEGDSISYRFTTPKMSQNMDVTNYRILNNPGFYSNFASGSESLGPTFFNARCDNRRFGLGCPRR